MGGIFRGLMMDGRHNQTFWAGTVDRPPDSTDGILNAVAGRDEAESIEPTEDPGAVLRQSRRAEIVLALLTSAFVVAAILTPWTGPACARDRRWPPGSRPCLV